MDESRVAGHNGSSISRTIHLGSPVYVRYMDHVLFRNMRNPISVPVNRETIGWLVDETGNTIRIQWDKTSRPFLDMNDSPHSGLLLLKSSILEIRALPLQNFLHGLLNCENSKDTITECAFQTKRKRKTQHKSRTGANP